MRPGDFDTPTDPARIFGRAGPLFVEIGFGSGRFLVHLADHHPQANLLGVEISAASVKRSMRRLRRRGHQQVKLVAASGEFVVRDILPRSSVDRVYINFPDPWPKDKHHGRRLLQPEFFATLADRLADEGHVALTTDHEDYFRWALESAQSTGLFEIRRDHPPTGALKTKYGHRWQQRNKTIHHATFSPQGEAEAVAPLIEVRDTMHHAIVEGTLPEIDGFTKTRRELEEGQTLLLDAFRDADGGRLLFLARTEEPDLIQDVLVEVYVGEEAEEPGANDRIVVRVKPFNTPLLTDATATAVEMVADWVAETREENAIAERRY